MSGSSDIDYAFLEGYRSMAAAIVFALLYAPLIVLFVRFLFIRRDRPVISMVLFCLIRTTAFIIRAVLIGNKKAGETLGLYIADQVLFSIGFFGLLLAAFEVVTERTEFVEKSYFDSGLQHATPRSPFILLARNNHVFRGALMAALIVGIIGVSNETSSSSSTASTGSTLRKVSAIIFLILTALQALNTLYLVRLELSDQGIRFPQHAQFGARSGSSILALISVLLLIREIFVVATISNSKTANNEHFWYPLVAVPELVSVVLYLIPGVIPPKQVYDNYSK